MLRSSAGSTWVSLLGILHPGLDELDACVAADAGKEHLLPPELPLHHPLLDLGAGPGFHGMLSTAHLYPSSSDVCQYPAWH